MYNKVKTRQCLIEDEVFFSRAFLQKVTHSFGQIYEKYYQDKSISLYTATNIITRITIQNYTARDRTRQTTY